MVFEEKFFEKEIRNDFEIESMMKRAWAAATEVLLVISDVCKKNNITFFADGGTLLGAVRHKGFIPWDDDIDICMKRDDYMRFIRLAPKELPKGFVLAGMYSPSKRLQDAAYVPHARVIADETIWDFNLYMRYFHGFPYQRIGIDIFPIDVLPDNKADEEFQMNVIEYGIETLRDWNKYTSIELKKRLDKIQQVCNVKIPVVEEGKNELWRTLDSICMLCNDDPNPESTVFTYGYHFKREWFDEVVMLPFENIEVPAPKEYDKVLTTEFGDYMTPVKFAAVHDYPFYGHMEAELKKQIANVGFKGTVEEFCQEVSSGRLRV